MLSDYPRADKIREALLSRADALSNRTGLHRSAISKRAVNDTSFLHKVAAGENFTIRSYERVMTWIDTHDTSQRQPGGFVKRQKRAGPRKIVTKRRQIRKR